MPFPSRKGRALQISEFFLNSPDIAQASRGRSWYNRRLPSEARSA
jgi:hypothetical protein